MCGIFGAVTLDDIIDILDVKALGTFAEERGRDSSGLVVGTPSGAYSVYRADLPVSRLFKKVRFAQPVIVAGHSRLATNGVLDNQPVVKDGMIVLHNGIICNIDELWSTRQGQRKLTVDSEIIPAIIKEERKKGGSLNEIAKSLFSQCEGVISAAVFIPEDGLLWLFSNNGSLYTGVKQGVVFFSSESWPLKNVECDDIVQIKGAVEFSVVSSKHIVKETEVESKHRPNLLPEFIPDLLEENLLQCPSPKFKRCTKCILPDTMPYIKFDSDGICNYCHNYVTKNHPKPVEDFEKLLEPYRRAGNTDCIVPFSGGRDSCYGLHLIVKELGMNPIAYTYDWGMVTDLGRRNISRMCAEMGVENIIIAPDIELKRRNIHKNLAAWLKRPHLGMISLLTAGDKHFFRHVETVKKQTGISLNLWGVNPLEVTHFKTGFLGIPPEFETEHVYKSGLSSQLNYQSKRFKQMVKNPGYFNSSLGDTISGEYWRSINKKTDYFHVFDFWEWNEEIVDNTLRDYGWEWANDTSTSWRIGDATAAFYNYIYFTVAGFTEHDTFRSNQIREGVITRDEALRLAAEENQPRYESIKWYLDAVGIDFKYAIEAVNNIPKLYAQ
jgi:glucosamine--fructose-6-phosphate aminotransferase (isomerizing)